MPDRKDINTNNKNIPIATNSTLENADETQSNAERTSTIENVQDNQSPAVENIQDNQSTTEENIQDNKHTTVENIQDNQSTTEENIQDNKYTTVENVQDNRSTTVENIQDKKSTAVENIQDNKSTTIENLQDNKSTTVERTNNTEQNEQINLNTIEQGTSSTSPNVEDPKSSETEMNSISSKTKLNNQKSDRDNDEKFTIEFDETQQNEEETKDLAEDENVASTSDFGKKESIEEFCEKISNQSSNFSIMCRICYDDTLDEPIISPCKCKGSIGMMHKSCLEKWLAESNTNRCDLCFHRFDTERTTKFSVYNSIYRWIRYPPTSFAFPIRDMRSDMVTCMVLIPFSIFLVYLCLFAAEYYNRQNFSMIPVARWTAISVMFMGIVITLGFCTWIYLVMRYHSRVWYFWWQRETIVRIYVTEVIDK